MERSPNPGQVRVAIRGETLRSAVQNAQRAIELDEKSRRKLDGCEGIIADMDGQNVLYYSDLYEIEMAWFTLSEGQGC